MTDKRAAAMHELAAGRFEQARALLDDALTAMLDAHANGAPLGPADAQSIIDDAAQIEIALGHETGPGSPLQRDFIPRAMRLCRTPGPRALWETLEVELQMAQLMAGMNDREIARDLLEWLRGTDPTPTSLTDATLALALRELRGRIAHRSLIAFLPMNLELVLHGQRTLAEALAELALFDANDH